MNKTNIKLLWRNIKRKPVYSFISISGFSIAITASLLICLWVLDETRFEEFHPSHEDIYRVLTLSRKGGELKKTANSARALAATLKEDYPQIEEAALISFSSEDSPLIVKETGKKIEARRAWVNDGFFVVFDGFKFIEGSQTTALKDKNNIILSKRTANKLFGNESALGKTILSNKYNEILYKVGGVIDIPDQSHIQIDYLLPAKNIRSNWRLTVFDHTYIKLSKNAVITRDFKKNIRNHLSKYTKTNDRLLFQALTDIHLYTDYEVYLNDKHIGHFKYVWIFSGLAVLIMIMAAMNFASLTIARSSDRATEVGIRKISGSKKSALSIQFISESVIQTSLALVIAVGLTALLLPWFSSLTNKGYHISDLPIPILVVFLFSIIVGALSGFIPSSYLSSFNPVLIFKGGNPEGSKALFIKALVVIQFTIAIIFIVATTTVFKQLQYINNKELGINKSDIVVIHTGLWYRNKPFKQALLDNPNILGVTSSARAPVDFMWQTTFGYNSKAGPDSIEGSLFWVDEGFASTYGLALERGRFISQSFEEYKQESKKAFKSRKFPVVVNESFVKKLNVSDPILTRLNSQYEIIGVVKDFHYRPLHHKIAPLVMVYDPQCINTLNVRINSKNKEATLEFITDVYKKYRNGRSMSYSFFEDEVDTVYHAEKQMGNLILYFCLLAIFIAIIGMFGLSIFAIDRRGKEIGIRKVNGAKIIEVLTLLNMDFVKWITVSFLFACPVSYLVMNNWLESFAYKTELSWWIFALAGFSALGIALMTVSWQSWKAATRNPVEALRYE
ncbi:ABC transporter permease [Labilibacter marinus]|uniref:ABC transporter permease n=1 Tax=Labilibacter marinus TaxID=1477105 RepID=UPI000829DBED|nr:ABC transporter permease [Labilibacter marinus]